MGRSSRSTLGAHGFHGPVRGTQAGRAAIAGANAVQRTRSVERAVGKRSLAAVPLLKALGYSNVKNSRGGLQVWTAEGLPLQIR